MENNNGFSVLDMAQHIADEEATDVKDLFTKRPTEEKKEEEPKASINEEKSVKKPWTPDAELLEGMEEMNAKPVTYSKEELTVEESTELKNIADDNALQDSRQAMDSLSRIAANLEDAKKRHGIKTLNIPEGPYHASMTAAAGDTNYKRAQAGLDEILNEVKKDYPEFITEWADDKKNNPMSRGVETPDFQKESGKVIDIPVDKKMEAGDPTKEEDVKSEIHQEPDTDAPDLKIIIDKRNLPEVAWDQNEIDKIKKSKTVELQIVETMNLDYSQIDDADENAIDAVLAPYCRKTNDVVVALPASKYRCTVTGLSYVEVIDLNNSLEMNNLDGEKKKWSICYSHIHNPSIGPWEEYQWYIDPKTHKKVKLSLSAAIPPGINPDTVTIVTKFEDFLQKTSFMDLEFILWKILCATAMDQEVISIDCHAINNGKECGKSYDWVYRPSDLLMLDSIDPAILEDMENTGSASTEEKILEAYNSSMLRMNNTTKLHSSGFSVVFGHISAWDYLSNIYGEIKALQDKDSDDPTLVSQTLMMSTLTAVKAFLIPKENGRFTKVTGTKNLIKVINTLDAIDWQTLSEIVRIMLEPYQFRYALRDIVCPQCKNRSIIPIDDMTRLLFIVARSLSSVNVTLKRT